MKCNLVMKSLIGKKNALGVFEKTEKETDNKDHLEGRKTNEILY